MTTPLLTAALSYAARGWPVFPLHSIRNGRCTCPDPECGLPVEGRPGEYKGSPGKHPRTKTGFKEASTDPETIRRWWAQWPDANIGIRTGAESGIVAIDVDPRHGGDETLRVIIHEHDPLPDTVEAATGGGGQHFLLQHPGGAITKKGVGIGVDLKADGGYIVGPPSTHISGGSYQWTRTPDDIDPAPMPDWLVELVNPAPATPPPPIPRRPATPRQDGNGRYGAAALADELDELRAAPEGERNDHLNRSAFRLAQLVADGHLDGETVRQELQAAGESIGLSSREVANTIRSGMNGGVSKPRAPHHADAPVVKAEPATAPTSGPVVVSLCDVEARPVSWLWPGRIPLARITLLVGRPGCGKSFLTLDAAARVTTGTPWPDGAPCPQGDVILISAEDDPADTIRPRLDAHHGDARRVHLLRAVTEYNPKSKAPVETCFTLADVAALELVLQRHPETKMIVVDPVGSYLGGKVDSHKDNEVRSVLAPVAMLAERYGVAVVVVCHTRKASGTAADDLAMGSRGFVGIARSVLHLSTDVKDKTRRLLLPGKCNLTAKPDGLAFTISGEPPRLWWEKDPVKLDADEALAEENAAGHPGRDPEALREAADWLREALADGPRLAKELIEEAQEEHSIAKRTLDRARRELGVVAYREERQGPWSWRLPAGVTGCQSQIANTPKTKECGNVAICDFDPENAAFEGESGVQDHRLPDCHILGEPGGLLPDAPDPDAPASPWATMAERDEDGLTAVERAERYRREAAGEVSP